MEIPRGHLHGGLRHVVPANRLERREQVARVREVDAEHARRDERLDDVPRRVVRLAAVVRILLGDAFAEARHAAVIES